MIRKKREMTRRPMGKKLKKNLKLFISIALSFIILFLIYKRIDFAALSEHILKVRIFPSLVFLFLFVPQLLVATWRWNLLTGNIGGVRFSMFTSFKQVVGSYSANLIIPGKMGEIVRIPWMRKYNMKTSTLILVILEKLLDILAIMVILFIAAALYRFIFSDHTVVLDIVLFVLFLAFILLLFTYFYRKRLSHFIEKWFSGYLKTKGDDFFYFRLKTAFNAVNRNITTYFLISVLLWIIQGLELVMIFYMFSIRISLVMIYTGSFIALLAGAVPVSIAGFGPRDAVIISFFRHLASYEALAGVGIISLFRIIIPALIGLPFFLLQTKE
jgi:uncharacterized protein (TIRG00374 family)